MRHNVLEASNGSVSGAGALYCVAQSPARNNEGKAKQSHMPRKVRLATGIPNCFKMLLSLNYIPNECKSSYFNAPNVA